MLIKDVETIIITSPFGLRIYDGQRQFHPGIDIRTWDFQKNCLIPIVAPESLKCIAMGESSWGDFAIFETLEHTYICEMIKMWHLDFVIKQGDELRIGDEIGVSQIKGLNKSYHLHFETHKNKSAFDPTIYLSEIGQSWELK